MSHHPAEFLRPRKIPRQSRSRNTWDVIIEAAAQVFAARGYEGTSTNLIAERAGVSIGTVYEYFPNKEVLLSELQSHWNDTCWAQRNSFGTPEPHLDLREAVRLMLQRWISVIQLNPALYAALVNELPTRRNKWKADERLRQNVAFVRGQLQKFPEVTRQGLPLTCEVLIRGIQSYLDETVVQNPERLESDALVEGLTELFCRTVSRGNGSA